MLSRWRIYLKQLSLALCVASVVTLFFLSGAFERIEWLTFDQRMRYANKEKALSPDIAVILIDEAALKTLDPIVGRFPWPRSVYADVLDFLALGQPRAVVFDILFTEQDKSLQDQTPAAHDQRLIDATQQHRFVFHAAHFSKEENNGGEQAYVTATKMPTDFMIKFGLKVEAPFNLPVHHTFALPINGLHQAASGIGIVSIEPDADGTYRRAPLLHRFANKFYPALALAPLINEHEKVIVASTESVRLGNKNIPLQRNGKFLLNAYGKYQAYSLSGIIAAMQQLNDGDLENLIVSPQEFKNKFVFIGVAAAGLEDVKATPLSAQTPGVILHATALSNVLENSFLTPASPYFTVTVIFVLALIVHAVIFQLRKTIINLVLPVIVAAGFSFAAFWSFQYNYVVEMSSPLAAIILSWLTAVTYLSFVEGKDKRKVRRMLAQYVAPTILTEVVDKYEDHLKAEIGTKVNVTTMFSDVRGFTNISERLKPEQVVELLNCHFSEMVEAIFKYEGTLDKFIGDAIMAFWGAPLHKPNHALNAATAAMEMIDRLSWVNTELNRKNLPSIRIGIGLNTGDVILGNIGSEKKLDYTIIGDNVNLASRMEGLTGKYGCDILLSEYTQAAVSQSIPCAMIDLVKVKGKEIPIGIYMPLITVTSGTNEINNAMELAEQTKLAFNLYLKRDWQGAMTEFTKLPLLQLRERMLDRCRFYRENEPPQEWDGVQTLTSK